MYNRLTEIDDLTRPDHSFLEPTDRCYYMGEYTARAGFSASPTNDLIQNLKKPMDRKGRTEWKWKAWAIGTIAKDLRSILGRDGMENVTFVPAPPSKAKSELLYDDRLLQILSKAAEGYDADIRELVLQKASMEAAHESDFRPSIRELINNYHIDDELTQVPRNNNFVIFDDVLTTGAHFKAMQHVLLDRFPEAQIYGLFVARRAPNTDDIENFF